MRTAYSAGTSAPLPPDTYVYKILAVDGKLASISSDDSLRLIDLQTVRLDSDGTLDRIHNGVTCLKTFQSLNVLTAGRDGLLKSTDARTRKTTLALSKDSGLPLLSIACTDNVIAAGTELINSQATIIVWDSRAPKKPLLEYVESHNDDITDLSFHPSNPSILLSGSTDGLVNLYDTTITDEDDALTQVFNHGSSIAHTGFLSDHDVFALSHDEKFSIYDTRDVDQDEDAPKSTHAFGDLRPQLQCEYVVDVVTSNSTEPILGAGSHSAQYLDIVPLQNQASWTLDTSNTIRLPGAHGEEIVRSICLSDNANTIFTAGEDGLIKAWRIPPEQAERAPQDQEEPQLTRKKRKKHKNIGKDEQARFKPY